MKQTHRCPKCLGRNIGYLPELWDRTISVRQAKDRADVHAMYKPQPVGIRVVKKASGGKRCESHGLLEAYVCTDCGYLETYVKNPGNLSFSSLKGFRLLNPPPEGPYR